MKIGCCVNMLPREANDVGEGYAPLIKEAGFDYIELPLGIITGLSEEAFAELRRYLAEVGLPVPVCNSIFARDICLVGERVDEERIRAFCKKALTRAEQLGARYVVFGSPWAKECPEGFSREKAFEQLTYWCRVLGDEAERHGLVIALEPNNRGETNMINTFSDVVALAKAADHPAVRCLQDYYHLRFENDTVESLLRDGRELLVHLHFARFEGRGFPVSMAEDEGYRTFFDALRAIDYQGALSLECFPESAETLPREAAESCRFLREQLGD